MSECAIYLANSPKSNTAYAAIGAALETVERTGNLPVPLHLRNAPTKLMADLGYHKGGTNMRMTTKETSWSSNISPMVLRITNSGTRETTRLKSRCNRDSIPFDKKSFKRIRTSAMTFQDDSDYVDTYYQRAVSSPVTGVHYVSSHSNVIRHKRVVLYEVYCLLYGGIRFLKSV